MWTVKQTEIFLCGVFLCVCINMYVWVCACVYVYLCMCAVYRCSDFKSNAVNIINLSRAQLIIVV